MTLSDPIADFLTRIRNAVKARKRTVEIPNSKLKTEIAKILKEHYFIRDYQIIEDNKQGIIKIYLKYINGNSAISGLERVSTPGLRLYAGKDKLPRVKNGLGIMIVSTSKGIMSDKKARSLGIGGELICKIW